MLLASMAPIGAPKAHAVPLLGSATGYIAGEAIKNSFKEPSTQIECNGITQCLTVLMYYVGPMLATKVAYIGAYFFSIVIQLSLNSTAYALDFLSKGWETVRDIANMTFIFILIYIAVMVMLEAETAGTIKTLAVVVLVALLVNFSFFFTRVAIDTGNILALQFYNAIPAGTGTDGKIVQINGVKDLSTSIMGAVGPQVLLSKQMFDQIGGNQSVFSSGAWAALGTFTVIYLSVAVMLWMLFFIFVQVGIKFLLRIVGLWFLLIASPLAFVARTMPQTAHFFHQWLRKLIEFSAYPAIFLFMFLILTRFSGDILSGGTTGGASTSLMNAIANTAGNATAGGSEIASMGTIAAVFIRMGFIIALMYVALKVSDWVVKEGSSIASTVSGGVFNAGKSAAKWGPGWAAGAAYRQTGGRLANAASKGVAGSRWANDRSTLWGKALGTVGYRLNKNVLKPMTETSLGTVASSYKVRKEFLDTRNKEMGNNLRDVENRELSSKIKPIIERNIAAGDKAEKGIDATDLGRLQALDKRQMGTLDADHIKTLSHIFTESQSKIMSDLEKMNEQQKDEAHANYENHSPHAMVRQAQKEIELLRDINTKLGGIPTLTSTLAAGITIKDANIKDLKDGLGTKLKEVTKQFEDARLARDTSTMATLSATRQTVNDGLTHVKELEKKIEKTNKAEIISPKV